MGEMLHTKSYHVGPCWQSPSLLQSLPSSRRAKLATVFESGIMNSFADRVPGGCMKIPAQVLWGWPSPKDFPGAAAPQ